jgi:hypothetical protein
MILVETRVSYDRKTPDAKAANAKSAPFRSYVYRHTMMWGTDALRVLPTSLWSEFAQVVDRFKDNLSSLCKIEVHYLPYPENKTNAAQPDLFAETAEELRRRTNIMYSDVCHRIGLVLDEINDSLKIGNSEGESGRLYDSVFTGVGADVRLFRAFNEAAFKSDTLNQICDGLSELSSLELNVLRRNKQARQDAWQKSIDLLNILSKA